MFEGQRRSRVWRSALPTAGLLLLIGCGGGEGGTANPVAVASVSVTLASAQLLVGQTTNATATTTASDGSVLTGRTITWQSNDPSVATVAGSGSSAVVTAVVAGTTTIKAISEGVTGTSPSLTVSVPANALTALTVSPTTVTLATLGATQVITTTPTTATGGTVAYANSSTNTAVATVTTTGANPTITAVAGGTTTVTIQATGSGTGLTTNSISRTVTVTVTPVVTVQMVFEGTTVAITETVTATATPKAASGTALTDRPIAWNSSNPAVATVSSGSGATVTVSALSAGSTTITATSEGIVGTQVFTVRAAAGCAALAVDANTIALYHFNEGAGQVVTNSVGGGLNGTLGPDATTNQDPAWLATGRIGSALRFTRGPDDASSDYVLVNSGSTFPTNQGSVEMYVRPRAPYAHSNLLVAGFINFNVNINSSGGIEFGIGNGTTWHIINSNTPNLNDGNWHQVVATYDGATMKVFVDGVERTAVASTTVLTNPGNFYIGGRPSNTFLNGDLDELRISNIARSGATVATNYCP